MGIYFIVCSSRSVINSYTFCSGHIFLCKTTFKIFIWKRDLMNMKFRIYLELVSFTLIASYWKICSIFYFNCLEANPYSTTYRQGGD